MFGGSTAKDSSNAKGDGRENGFAIGPPLTRQCCRHVVEAATRRLAMSRHQGMVCPIIGEAFQRDKAMFGGYRADRVHPVANSRRGEARHSGLDFVDPLANHLANIAKCVVGHFAIPTLTGRLSREMVNGASIPPRLDRIGS
jgi:hypothetical protein